MYAIRSYYALDPVQVTAARQGRTLSIAAMLRAVVQRRPIALFLVSASLHGSAPARVMRRKVTTGCSSPIAWACVV